MNVGEYSLKRNNFNPVKGSPNNFMHNLERRIQFHYMNCQLENDPLTLDIK